LAKSHGLPVEELRALVEKVRWSWALEERRWRDAHDPTVSAFRELARPFLRAWDAMPDSVRINIDANVAADPELRVVRSLVGPMLERLSRVAGNRRLWREVATGKPGLPPHTQEAIGKLAEFWEQKTGHQGAPYWAGGEQKEIVPGRGGSFIIDALVVTTGVKPRLDQLRDIIRKKGRGRTKRGRRSPG
jgi:hypothetical protein